jgi:hypothetical protein
MKPVEIARRIFVPSVTDETVDQINAESKATLEEASKVAKRHRDLLRRNGVALQVKIAAGGGHGR